MIASKSDIDLTAAECENKRGFRGYIYSYIVLEVDNIFFFHFLTGTCKYPSHSPRADSYTAFLFKQMRFYATSGKTFKSCELLTLLFCNVFVYHKQMFRKLLISVFYF